MRYRPIYYDTETTGTKPDKDKIIEIAAFDAYNDRSFTALINPKEKIPAEATKIHNITNEMVEQAPDFSVIGKEFLEFCSGDVVLIAHNNDAFDKPFLEYEFKRAGLVLPSFPYIDTLKWARKYRPDLPRHSLQFLREIFGIEENQAHRALDDVIVLAKIYSIMIDDLTIEQVLELLSAKEKPLTYMPFGKYQGKPFSEVPSDYVSWLEKNGVFEKPGNEALKAAFEKANLLGVEK